MSTVDARLETRERRAAPWTTVAWTAWNALQLLFTLAFTASAIVLALLVRLATGSPRLPLRICLLYTSRCV